LVSYFFLERGRRIANVGSVFAGPIYLLLFRLKEHITPNQRSILACVLLQAAGFNAKVPMGYEVIPLLVGLAVPLLAGLALIVDGVRRAIREKRKTNHDLHA
jgi:hypothetical protein